MKLSAYSLPVSLYLSYISTVDRIVVDHFFDMFVSSAGRKIKEYLSNRQYEYPLEELGDKLLKRRVVLSDAALRVAAVDGGIGVVRLSNGHQVIFG